MKFLTPKEQFRTIQNSYAALATGGVAMHIIHEPSIKGTSELRSWQYRVNPERLVVQLKKAGIRAKMLEFESESHVGWLRKTTVITLSK
jgi:hypothetical protein